MSNEPTIEQMNEAIALFMGMEGNAEFIRQNYAYHLYWQQLMPVVEKIEQIENGRFGFTVDPWEVVIIDYGGCYDGKREVEIVSVHREREPGDKRNVLLGDYYEAVTKFIQWYNKQSII